MMPENLSKGYAKITGVVKQLFAGFERVFKETSRLVVKSLSQKGLPELRLNMGWNDGI